MMNEHLVGYERHLKERGIWNPRTYVEEAAVFLRWFSDKSTPLSDLTPEMIYEYLRFRRARFIKRETVRDALVYLRHFLRYARLKQLISHDPSHEVSVDWIDIAGGFHSYRGAVRRLLKTPYYVARYQFPLFTPFFEDYLSSQLDKGYTRTSLGFFLHFSRKFHEFLVARRVKRLTDVKPTHLESFVRSKTIFFRKKNGRPLSLERRSIMASAVERFLIYAFEQCGRRFRPHPRPSRSGAIPDALINDYLEFSSSHKGLKSSTLHSHRHLLVLFRLFLGRRRIRRIQDVTVPHLDSFAIDLSKRFSAHALGGYVSILRSFFRYLLLKEVIAHDLASRLVSPCRFSADRRPKYISWRKVETLLQKINRATPAGKRNYAIVVLFTSYGLRCREVANLKLSDIDFDNASLLLRARKNGRNEKMPLMPVVAEALRDYLSIRSQQPSHDHVFLTTHAPIKPLTGKGIACLLERHLANCLGPIPVRGGGYLIRHSFAKKLLDRGAKISEIGAVLGHARLNSTMIYTRIATEELREVADNYASLLCR